MLNKTQEFVAQAELFLATAKDFFSSHCTYTPFLSALPTLICLAGLREMPQQAI